MQVLTPPERNGLKASLAALALVLAATASAQPSVETDPSRTALPEIPAPGNQSISLGSGFVVDDGYILTAWHVVQRYGQILVGPSPAGRWVQGQVVKFDASQDLALLKAPLQAAPIALAPSADVPIGLEVTVIGYPQPRLQGMTRKITQGLISGVQTPAQESLDSGSFQISAEVTMGNSGGPVFAPDGVVVGMVQRKLSNQRAGTHTSEGPRQVGFALRSSTLIRFLQDSPARPRVTALSLNTLKRPYEIFQDQGRSVVSIIGRNPPAPTQSPPGTTQREQRPTGP
jgi:S1-C subfamily serine protease